MQIQIHKIKKQLKQTYIVVLFLSNFTVFSQDYKTSTEIGFYGGGAYYIGDLNPNKHFINSKPAFGLVYRNNRTLRHSLRITAFYGSVYGDDAESNSDAAVNRNLNFESDLLELAVGYEVNFFRYFIGKMKHPITPYFFYQLAYTRMNPTTNYNGNEIALQSLGTEGQGMGTNPKRRYGLNQITVPLGVGVKFNIVERLAISFEYGIRKTFTDYLDDVSGNYVDSDLLRTENGPLAAELSDRRLNPSVTMNRGNPNNKDWYAFYGVMLTFKPFKRDICKDMKWR